MLVPEKEALSRLNSPDNLLNRMRSLGNKPAIIPTIPLVRQQEAIHVRVSEPDKDEDGNNVNPTIDDLVHDADKQIHLSTAHDNALKVLNGAIRELAIRIPEIKADKLPAVITATSKVVESIRRERSDLEKNRKNNSVHFHFYTPAQRQLSDYEVIEVG